MPLYRPIQACIHLSAFQHNLNVARTLAPQSKVLAIVKSNGYGHGIETVARELAQADGFGVASIDEGMALRQRGFLHPIVLLEGVFSEAEWPLVAQHRLEASLHNWQQLEWLQRSRIRTPLTLWLKVDTGMHRLGFEVSELDKVLAAVEALPMPVQVCWMSHLASAEESEAFSMQQFSVFEKMTAARSDMKSLANSAAIQRYPQMHYDWVRPGIMLYGAGAEARLGLQPTMSLISKIISLKWVPAGESVGYGQAWVAPRRSLIAAVAAGYGDGYPRCAPAGTPVLIHGQRMPMAGRVSMDMLSVDVTELAERVAIGDSAILWGQGLPVDEIAQACGTIGYELLCNVTQRVPRLDCEQVG
ncbi:MAG: alanine racemase [Hydrogenovibrio sp.]